MTKNELQQLLGDESLSLFLRGMAKFDREFTELMNEGQDFTIKLEVHGNGSKLIHCRVSSDGFSRPASREPLASQPSTKKGGR